MSQVAKTGRRTPLTLGPNKNRKSSLEADEKNDPLKTATTADKHTEDTNLGQLKAKIQTDLKSKQSKQAENGAKNGTTSKNGAASNDNVKVSPQVRLDKIKDSPQTKATISADVKDENNKTKSSPAKLVDKSDKSKQENGSQKVDKKDETKGKDVKESPQKIQPQDNKASSSSSSSEAVAAQKSEKNEKTPIEMPITPELTPSKDSPKSKQDNSSESSPSTKPSTPNVTPTSKIASQSLLEEKELKGFNAVGEEMGSLILEPEINDSPMPKDKRGKILKLKQGPPSRARISPFRKNEKLQNASTIVNLSTVSEQSTELGASMSTSSSGVDDPKYTSLRMISGRRSTRPLAPMAFQHSIRDSSYRRLPNDFNDTAASLNVTVGSEIPIDSFCTPIGAVKGQARKRTVADTDDVVEPSDVADKSPKKPRLDISGFLGVLASPVTMLRAKFRRTHIQCSTPNEKLIVADPNDSINSEYNENLNVSGIENEEAMVEDTEGVEPIDTASVEDGELEKLKLLADENAEAINDNEPPIIVKEVKKSRCHVM